MKKHFLILAIGMLFFGCTQDSILSVEFQAKIEDLTSLDAEVASLINLTYAEAGLISKVTKQIRGQKLAEADLTSEELIARLDISEEELAHFSEKMSTLQALVEQNGYSQEQVAASVRMQLTDRFTSLNKATPCYNVHQLEVQVASVAAVACLGVAALTGGWAIPGCGVAYVAAVGLSRVKYENCILSRTGG